MRNKVKQQLESFLHSLSLTAGESFGLRKVFDFIAQAACRDLDCLYLRLELQPGAVAAGSGSIDFGNVPAAADRDIFLRAANTAFTKSATELSRFDTEQPPCCWSAWPLWRANKLLGILCVLWKRNAGTADKPPGEIFHAAFNMAAMLIGRGLTIDELRAQQAALIDENLYLREEVKVRFVGENIIWNSGCMEDLLQTALRVAASRATVLIHGETGTGKELLAHLIHKHSPRANAPFIRVNCAALPDNLLESELFGHVKGAFTGAVSDRKGRFEAADGGTLLLDEVGDISGNLQMRLLRVLQEREIERVGDHRPRPIDVRVIAATHWNLEEAVAAGRFREDLYYRLNVVYLHIPPLRARPEDIIPLCEHFLDRFNQENYKQVALNSSTVISLLQQYSWPGNVRELQNCIEKAVVLAPGGELTPDLLPSALTVCGNPPLPPVPVETNGESGLTAAASAHTTKLLETNAAAGDLYKKVISETEKALFATVMQAVRGNQLAACRLLGINRNTLRKRLQEYGL